MSNDENMINSFKAPRITSYLGNKYILKYNVKFTLRKLIIILDLLFF